MPDHSRRLGLFLMHTRHTYVMRGAHVQVPDVCALGIPRRRGKQQVCSDLCEPGPAVLLSGQDAKRADVRERTRE